MIQLETFLYIFILIPAAGFALSIVLPSMREQLISRVGFVVTGIHLVIAHIFTVVWALSGSYPITHKEFVLFKTNGYEYFLDFHFDKITAVYLIVGAILTFLVMVYSGRYLHREPGYKRFFNTVHFFYTGYNIVILSGNLETLFAGWEIIGISSFLLIAFYRDRYLPVKNAIKVFSIYRIGDAGIIVAMWLSHHMWHENITFFKLNNYQLVHHQLESNTLAGIVISVMLLISAAVKSAQLPFSSWLPRAMEGPTPSSAIFYGSLSVHLGAFLLLRTFPFWEHQMSVRVLIAATGLLTSIIGTGIARVQFSIKSQIAYASISQIGIIFIEIALGLENLALFHFAGNAFLRTYQLLVSPSVVTYLIREQFYHFVPREKTVEDSLPKKIEFTFYMLCLKEWNLDSILQKYLWAPFKKAGKAFQLVSTPELLIAQTPVYLLAVAILLTMQYIPPLILQSLPIVFSIIGFILILRAFIDRNNPILVLITVVLCHFWIALSISFNEKFTLFHSLYYLSGIAVSGLSGVVLLVIQKRKKDFNLSRFNGLAGAHPVMAFLFLMACLGVAGFPITHSFIGEDLIFTHIHESQYLLSFIVVLNFILTGIALIRLYARIFLGPAEPGYQRSY